MRLRNVLAFSAVLAVSACAAFCFFANVWHDEEDYAQLDDELQFTVSDHFGDVYVCGVGQKSGYGRDIVVIKYDREGELQWMQPYDGGVANGDDTPVGIAVDDLGYVYFAGTATISSHGTDYVVRKLDPSNGSTVWTDYYNRSGTSNDTAADMCFTRDGDLCVTGTCDGDGEKDIVTVVWDTSGYKQSGWENGVVLGANDDYDQRATGVSCNGSRVVICGYDQVPNEPESDTRWLVDSYDMAGARTDYFPQYLDYGSHDDQANDVYVDANNYIYSCGYVKSANNDALFAVMKWNEDATQVWDDPFTYDDSTAGGLSEDAIRVFARGDFVYALGWTTQSGAPEAPGAYDFLLAKINTSDGTGSNTWTSQDWPNGIRVFWSDPAGRELPWDMRVIGTNVYGTGDHYLGTGEQLLDVDFITFSYGKDGEEALNEEWGVQGTVQGAKAVSTAGPAIVAAVGRYQVQEEGDWDFGTVVHQAPGKADHDQPGYTLIAGSAHTGDADDLRYDDGEYLVFQGTPWEPSVVTAEFTESVPTDVDELAITVAVHASIAACHETIKVYNYDTQIWETVHVGFASAADDYESKVGFTIEGEPGPYVDPNGIVKLRVFLVDDSASMPYFSFDQVMWTVVVNP